MLGRKSYRIDNSCLFDNSCPLCNCSSNTLRSPPFTRSSCSPIARRTGQLHADDSVTLAQDGIVLKTDSQSSLTVHSRYQNHTSESPSAFSSSKHAYMRRFDFLHCSRMSSRRSTRCATHEFKDGKMILMSKRWLLLTARDYWAVVKNKRVRSNHVHSFMAQ